MIRQDQFVLARYVARVIVGAGWADGGARAIVTSVIDISTKAIEYGRRLIEEEDLAEKHPRLVVSRNKNLKFDEFRGECFDYLLAQSVFTHLKPEQIEECFEHVGALMHEGSAFFFTFYEGERFAPCPMRTPSSWFISQRTAPRCRSSPSIP